MRIRYLILLAAALAWAGCADNPVAPHDSNAPEVSAKPAPGRYIVVFDAGVTDVPGMAARLAHSQGAVPENVYQHSIKGLLGGHVGARRGSPGPSARRGLRRAGPGHHPQQEA